MALPEDRVLILAPTGRDAELTADLLAESSLQALCCGSIQEVASRLQEGAAALVLAEEALQPETVGLLLEALQRQPAWSDLPLIVLTARSTLLPFWAERIKEARVNLTLLQRPVPRYTLLSAVQASLRARRRQYELRELTRDLERRVEERTRELSESVRELETFTYTIAHDLRAPLRAMCAFSQILREEYGARLGVDGLDLTARIEASGRRMTRLVQDLLAYSRLTRIELNLEPVPLHETVERALAEFVDPEGRPHVKVQDPLPVVLGHPATLALVLGNLLTNALKFVAAGVVPSVLVGGASEGGRGRIWVQDNGIGIEEKHLDRIFGVFERLHTQESFPGTGMGLAIVRRALERMGGRVGVESQPGRGSRFWFELPLAAAAPVAADIHAA